MLQCQQFRKNYNILADLVNFYILNTTWFSGKMVKKIITLEHCKKQANHTRTDLSDSAFSCNINYNM